jgi:hypothetical protein
MAKRVEEPKGYNGWENYETWAVALWIDNEQGTYDERCRMVEEARENASEDTNVDSGIWTVEQAARYRLADTLKEWVTDELMPDLGASLAADLLGSALSEVDWNEIAENFLSE